MKIIKFKVLSNFRNLQGIELRFDVNVNTYVLIGNNGAGKSSLLEALSSIFQALFLEGSPPFEFAFLLVFKSDGRMISIVNAPDASSKFKLDGRDANRSAILPYLPKRVICNYSGEETRINNRYYRPVWEQHERHLKTASGGEALRMVFVDKDLWKIILFVIIAHQERYQNFKVFLKDILHVGGVARITLDINLKALDAWSENPVSYYMRQLTERIQPDDTINLPDINPDEYEAKFMFNHLSDARSLINDIHIVFDNGVSSDFLSEGEKKWMVVLFIIEVISDEQSLVLLDEPDSHIHVARQSLMAEMFRKAINRDNIVTSHSPTLTAKFERKEIIMLDRGPDGCVKVVDVDKQEVVSKLTDGMWSIQKQNIFLSSD
ncbi:MAG: AAA family ATPase, partial [Kiritimatiellae bacterium]|nr:AAA family ATPase [Kiritimatiellia bacterium]